MRMHEILQKLMTQRGISSAELARQLGWTSDSTLCRWLNNESEPRVSQAVRLAEHFGVSLVELLGEDVSTAPLPEPPPSLSDEDRAVLRYVHALNLTFDELVRVVTDSAARKSGSTVSPPNNHGKRKA